jgi:hypothetical protein
MMKIRAKDYERCVSVKDPAPIHTKKEGEIEGERERVKSKLSCSMIPLCVHRKIHTTEVELYRIDSSPAESVSSSIRSVQ